MVEQISNWVRWSKKNREKGLCKHCPTPTVAGKTRCQKHLEIHARGSKRKTDRRLAEGVCPGCEKVPSAGKKWCDECLRAGRESHAARVAGGGCTACGGRAAPPSAYCLVCYFRKAARMNLGLKGKEMRDAAGAIREKFEAQGGLCALSGLPMVPGTTASLDHVVPRSKGGTDAPENLRWILRAVNNLKGDGTDEEAVEVARAVGDRSRR